MIKTIGFTISYFIVAFIIGNIVKRSLGEKNKDLFGMCIYGVLLQFFIFEVVVCAMAYMGKSLTEITRIYLLLIGIVSGVGLIVGIFNYRARKLESKSGNTKETQNVKNTAQKGNASEAINENVVEMNTTENDISKRIVKKNNITTMVINLVIILLIAIQIYLSTKYVFLHEEDAFYTGSTTTSLATDSVLRYSPYTGEAISVSNHKADLVASLPYYFAVIAKILNVTGAYTNHIVVPCIFIIFGYMLYYKIGDMLFADGQKTKQIRNKQLFMFLMVVYNFFMGKTYTVGYEGLATCIWHGGSFLYAIGVPVLLYALGKVFFEKNKRAITLIALAGTMCIMTMKNTGIVVAVLVTMVAIISRILVSVIGTIQRGKKYDK